MPTPEVTRHCPVCGNSGYDSHWQKGTLSVVRCRVCGMLFANPVPVEFASGSYYDQVGSDFYLSPAKLESDYAGVRFERELRLFRQHCHRGRVLDVGCSSGAFLFHLNQRFPEDYEILGTDVSGAPLDYAESRGVPVARGNFLEMDFGGKQFDAITFWAVLEHLLEPGRFLTKAAKLVTARGCCVALVPNLNSLAIRLIGSRYRYVYAQHLNYFSVASLERLTTGVGWRVESVAYTHFNPMVIWQDWRQGGREVSNRERADLLRRTTGYKQNPLLAPVRVAYRLTERCLSVAGLADNLAVVLRRKD